MLSDIQKMRLEVAGLHYIKTIKDSDSVIVEDIIIKENCGADFRVRYSILTRQSSIRSGNVYYINRYRRINGRQAMGHSLKESRNVYIQSDEFDEIIDILIKRANKYRRYFSY